MPNLVLCFDGTSNQFGHENTNVVRLVQVLNRDPELQRLYYDPGVGTLPEPGTRGWLARKVSVVAGLAFGAGLVGNVEEAYSYLMDVWEPGDKVFLFGFSRGAYTARVLAGLLHAMGLLPRRNQNLLPYVLRLFKALRKKKGDAFGAHVKLMDDFRRTFARPGPDGSDDRRFRVHFLGVWDTVSSVGWIWDPAHFPFTRHNASIEVVRHALAVDERRWFFRQNQIDRAGEQDWQELWFPGSHCDVGGGYPEDRGGLWRPAFEWMLGEAAAKGLHVDDERLREVRTRRPPPERPWLEPRHESLTWYWWPAEFFPKLRGRTGSDARMPAIGAGRHRFIPCGSAMHVSTLRRIRDDANYSPPNLPNAFPEQVRALLEAPATTLNTDC